MVKKDSKKLPTVIVFFFMAVIFPISDAAAEEDLWDELGVYGGQIYTIAVDPDDSFRVYAGSWNGDGFFISEDEGLTWESNGWFRNSAVYGIAIDPDNTDIIWVANDHEIDKSTDGGATWSTYTIGDGTRFVYAVEINPFNSDNIILGTGGIDGASTGGAVFFTDDGGITWSEENDLIADFNIIDVDFNPEKESEVWLTSNTFNVSNKGAIYVWTDQGGEGWGWWGWTVDFYFDEILFHPSIPSLLFACGDYGVRIKEDASIYTGWGYSWDEENYFARAMCIPPQDTDYLYTAMSEDGTDIVAYGVNPWDSDDWYYTNSTDGVPSPAPDEFICLAADNFPYPDYYLYAGGINEGVFKSENQGETWSSISNGMLANSIYDSAVSPQDSSKLLLATLGGIYSNKSQIPIKDSISYAISYHPANEDIFYAGISWGLIKTTDGGISWDYKYPLDDISGDHHIDGESYRVLSVAVSPHDPQKVYAGVSLDVSHEGYLIKITDSGGDFTSAPLLSVTVGAPVNSIVFHPGNPDIIFIGSGGFYAPVTNWGINRSTDGGVNWPYINMGSSENGDYVVVNDIAIEQKPPYTMYAACGGSDLSYSGIYKSTDNGSTWVKKTGGLPDNYAVTDIKIDPDDSSFVYAAVYKGYDDCSDSNCKDMNGVYISVDAGEYWSPMGLSDYYMYDVNVYNTGSTVSTRTKEEGRSFSYPQTSVVGGSASGGHSTLMSTGRGTVTGFVKDADTGAPVADAVIKTDTGSKCKTEENGFYMLFTASGTHRVSFWSPTHVSKNVPKISVGNGQQVTLDANLKAGSSDSEDTTCFLNAILGTSRSKELDPFRAFRDNVLGRTKYGKSLVDLYYRSGPEILKAVGKNPDLKRKSLGIIERAIPLFKSISEKERATFSTEFLNEVSAFLFELENHVSPELKKTIYKMRLSIKRNDLFEKLSVKKQRQIEPKDKTLGPEKACRP